MPRERTFWLVLASLVVVGVVAGSFTRRSGTYQLAFAPDSPAPRPQEASKRIWKDVELERIATVPVALPTLLRPGPGGDVYVLDSGELQVLRISPDGRILAAFRDTSLGNLTDVAVGQNGEVWACDLDHNGIVVFSASGKLVRKIELEPPIGRLARTPRGFVATSIAGGEGLFRQYSEKGEMEGAFGAYFPEEFNTSIAADGWIIPGKDGFFYPLRNAGYILSYGWDGKLRFFRNTIDLITLPEVRADSAGRQSVPAAALVSMSGSVVGNELFVLTGGKMLDVYDAETGSYRYSLRPPEKDARYVVLTGDRLYSASGRTVTVWKPRNPAPWSRQ